MKAEIFVKDGKSYKAVTLPSPVDSFVFQAFIEKNDLAATVMSELWGEVTSKYGEIDRVVISDYEVTRNIAGEPATFSATATISNLNMVAMLAGLAKWQDAKRNVATQFSNVKAMLKQAVTEEIHGYEAGKRGRHAKQGLTQASAIEAARKALA